MKIHSATLHMLFTTDAVCFGASLCMPLFVATAWLVDRWLSGTPRLHHQFQHAQAVLRFGQVDPRILDEGGAHSATSAPPDCARPGTVALILSISQIVSCRCWKGRELLQMTLTRSQSALQLQYHVQSPQSPSRMMDLSR